MQIGALDCWFTPIQMKKNRPATLLSAMCRPQDVRRVANLILQESTALGARIYPVRRVTQTRSFQTVSTPYGDIRVKVSGSGRIKPEYEDVKAAAAARGVPLWKAEQAARLAFARSDESLNRKG